MLNYTINQVYDKEFNKIVNEKEDMVVICQQREQMLGIEQRKANLKKRAKRIRKNQTMAEIMNTVRKNLAAGNIIKVGY